MPGSAKTSANAATAASSSAAGPPPLMFVYRHSAALTEADDLRDAILLFHPPDTPLEKQCVIAGQLMGTTGFIRAGLLSQPAVFDLDNGLRVACAHSFDSDLTLCIGAFSAGSDAAVRDAVAKLHLALQLYCGPLALAFWTAPRHQPDLQDRLTPLAGRLLSLYCPSGYPQGMLALASGRIRMLPLLTGGQSQASARRQQRRATAPLSRLLLASDCLADRIAACCCCVGVGGGGGSGSASSADVLGCAVFAHVNNSLSLLSSTGLPAWLYAALSIVADQPDADALPLLHRVGDLPRQSSSSSSAAAGVDVLAFHAFLPAEDWPAGLQIDLGGDVDGGGGRGRCLGRCGSHRSAPRRLSSMCEAAILASRFRRLSASWPVGSGCVRCQCVMWLPKHRVTADGTRLRIVAVVSPTICAGCVCAAAAPLLTVEQLRPLSDAFAAAGAASAASPGIPPESLDSSPGSVAASTKKPLIFCPPLAAPSSADIVQRFPEDASLALASLVAADVTSTTCQDVNSASLATSAFSIRVDGQLRVSASRSDGLLTLSDTVDLSYCSDFSIGGGGGGGISAGFPRRRRGVTPRASVSGSPLGGDSAGGRGASGSGGLLAVPPTSTTPRRSRSFIGALRPSFRKL